jgi:hypothetical protein
VETVEAWFFIDKLVFEKINPILTEVFVNSHFNNILGINPETIKNPSEQIEKIIKTVKPNFKYRKHKHEVHSIVSRIDFENSIPGVNQVFPYSLDRFITYLTNSLE